MSSDIYYVRCSESRIAEAIADEAVARDLMHGRVSVLPGESTECVDFHPRALEAVYGLLSLEFPEACVENGSDENNWLFLALNGYEIFPWPIDTGYGRPHFLRAPMVSKVASNLVHVNHEALGDASAVFQRLRDFFCAASAAHHAVLMTPLS